MKSIFEFLDESALNYPKKTAVIFENTKYSYSELLKKSELLSNILQNGIDKKNVVSILTENSIEFIISYFAVLKSGLVAHIMPPTISDTNLISQVKETNSKLILTTNNFNNKVKRTDLNQSSLYVDHKSLEKHNDVFNGNRFYDVSSIIFTSGTTSTPKGVKLQHKNILTSTSNIIDILGIKNDNIEINSLSLSHSFGLGCLHSNMMVGATSLIFKNTINIEEILKSGKNYLATGLVGVPNTFYRILDYYSELLSSMNTLKYLLTNTAPMKKEKILQTINLLPSSKFYTYYGLTEASRSTFLFFNENLDKIESVGKPPKNVEIKIVDENNHILSNNQIGEIFIKGDHVISNYWNNPEADKQLENGWLKTGDVGYLDTDGFLFLKSRKDDLINVSGEKFSPEEVENTINQINGVIESAVIGIPDSDFGQLPIAFVVANLELDSKDIILYCSQRLERFKIPRKIVFLKSIPKTDSGKIKRTMLKSNDKFDF